MKHIYLSMLIILIISSSEVFALSSFFKSSVSLGFKVPLFDGKETSRVSDEKKINSVTSQITLKR